jgi:hypothetical protein
MKRPNEAQVENLCHLVYWTFGRSWFLKIPQRILFPINGLMMIDNLDNPKDSGGTGFQPVQFLGSTINNFFLRFGLFLAENRPTPFWFRPVRVKEASK